MRSPKSKKKTKNKGEREKNKVCGVWQIMLAFVFAVSVLQIAAYFRWSHGLVSKDDFSVVSKHSSSEDEDEDQLNSHGDEEDQLDEAEVDSENDSPANSAGGTNDVVVTMKPKVEAGSSKFRSLHEAFQEIDGNDEVVILPDSSNPWQKISDDEVKDWFQKAEAEIPSKGGESEVVKVKATIKLVKQRISMLTEKIQKIRDDLIEDRFAKALDDIMSHSSEPISWTESDADTGLDKISPQNHERKEIPPSTREADRGACNSWSDQSTEPWSSKFLSFAIPDTVPVSHQTSWKTALQEKLAAKGAQSDSTNPEYVRILVLPWTLEASQLALDNVRSKSFSYKVLTTRLLSPEATKWTLTSGRQNLLAGLKAYFSRKTCTLSSLGIAPPSFNVVQDSQDCQALFSNFDDAQEMDVPWLVKSFSATTCGAGGCFEASPRPILVVRGLGALRKQFGSCQADQARISPVLVERAVLRPLLIRSKRFKLHALVLVTSVNPWKVFWNKGYISLSMSHTAAEQTVASIGKAVSSGAMIDTETTDFRLQQMLGAANIGESPIWDHKRFEEFLDTYGFCDGSKCKNLWNRVRLILRLLMEASITSQSDAENKVDLSKKSFQIFRVSFWVDESVSPFLHRGSSDLSALLDVSLTSLEKFRYDLLENAIRLSLGEEISGGPWAILKDQYKEECDSTGMVQDFDPCLSIAKHKLTDNVINTNEVDSRTSAKSREVGVEEDEDEDEEEEEEEDESSDENNEKRSKEKSVLGTDESEEDDSSSDMTNRGGSGTVVSESITKLPSPKAPLPMKRRGPHISLDEL